MCSKVVWCFRRKSDKTQDYHHLGVLSLGIQAFAGLEAGQKKSTKGLHINNIHTPINFPSVSSIICFKVWTGSLRVAWNSRRMPQQSSTKIWVIVGKLGSVEVAGKWHASVISVLNLIIVYALVCLAGENRGYQWALESTIMLSTNHNSLCALMWSVLPRGGVCAVSPYIILVSCQLVGSANQRDADWFSNSHVGNSRITFTDT